MSVHPVVLIVIWGLIGCVLLRAVLGRLAREGLIEGPREGERPLDGIRDVAYTLSVGGI